MSAAIIASLVSLIPNLLIAVHALLGWLKMRDRTRLLMLLVFSSSVFASLLSLATAVAFQSSGFELDALLMLADALTLFSSYAFFLFMAEFTRVRAGARNAVMVLLLLLIVGILISDYSDQINGAEVQVLRPAWLLLAEIVYFLGLVTFIAARFWQYSIGLTGISRKRVQAIALGTTIAVGSVALSIVAQSFDPVIANALSSLARAVGLAAGVIYYLGFATPRWLRDIWTSSERRVISNLSLATASGRSPQALVEDVLHVAIQISGAQGGALALWNHQAQQLEIRAATNLPKPLADELLAQGRQAWTNNSANSNNPVIARLQRKSDNSVKSTPSSLLDTPMFLDANFMGLIRLVADQSLVFEEEDAAIMQVLGAQGAVSIATAQRLEEVRQEAKRAGELYTEADIDLKQRVAELRAVLTSMADGLYAVDKDGVITMVNHAAAQMAGANETAAVGQKASAVFHFALDHNELIKPVLSAGEPVTYGETVLRVDNIEIPVSIAAAPLYGDDQQPGVVVINFRDITAEKEVQRVKDEFIATISHELRTPLTAILGYADLMLRGTPDKATQRQTSQLTAIRNNGSRLLSLINDLLDLSKIEAGQVTLNRKPVALANVVSRSLTSLQVLASNKKIDIQTHIPIDLPLVMADFDRLCQILDNLLSNAIKFTPNDGRISIDAQLQTGASFVTVSVADTGIGIEPEHLDRVWDRFYQVESSATRSYGGTGLGLPIVKHLVEMHGGELRLSSPGKDQGTVFSFTLPVTAGVEQNERHAPVIPLELAPSGGETENDPSKPLVLVAEDDPYFTHILRTQLESEGYRVAEAHDGAEALKLAHDLQPFAITLDVQLPRMDGWSVLNQLKRQQTTQHIPVLVLSVVDNRDFGMALGATDYLVKPINYNRLLDTLSRLANNSGEGASALVIEDDDDIRELLSLALKQGPWQIRTASDGEAGLAAIQQQKPDVVILDLTLPKMSGFEVLSSMRKDPETANIPVLIMTAKDLTPDETTFLSGAAQRLILKKGQTSEQMVDEVGRTLAAWRGAIMQK